MTEREELVDAMAKLVFEAVNPTCSWSIYKGSRTKGEFCKGISAALDEAVRRLLGDMTNDEYDTWPRMERPTNCWDELDRRQQTDVLFANRRDRYSAVEDPAIEAVMAKIGGDRQWAAQVVAIVDRARGRE